MACYMMNLLMCLGCLLLDLTSVHSKYFAVGFLLLYEIISFIVTY